MATITRNTLPVVIQPPVTYTLTLTEDEAWALYKLVNEGEGVWSVYRAMYDAGFTQRDSRYPKDE